MINSKIERRRKGNYGPEIGKKLIIQIEDVNLASLSVIELIRSLADKRGWFHLKTFEWMKFEDTLLFCTINKKTIKEPKRLTRHFNEIGFWEIKMESIFKVFIIKKILNFYGQN